MLGVISGILQTVALWKTADFKGKTLTADQTEAWARFWIGGMAASSTALGTLESGIRQFNLFANTTSKLRVLNSSSFLRWLARASRFLGALAGLVTAAFDLYHTYDEFQKGHTGLAWAYSLSAASGLWLTAAILSTIPVLGTVIATVILIGTAIYLAVFNQDNIQKWLEQCLWRRIPVNRNKSVEEQSKHKAYEESKLPIWPTMQMEMHELKLALGEG